MTDTSFDQLGCGCCGAGPAQHAIYNAPALSAIQYRIGTYVSFRERMILAASRSGNPVLRNWTARESRDYGVAFLEMWAELADILTFYQERIANEAFLRTAMHLESVRRLAALLDYKPAPGAAAVAYVAFLLEKNKSLELPVGLRIQSVPGQKEKPQKFELVEQMVASAALNSVRVYAFPAAYNPFGPQSTEGDLDPALAPRPGEQLVFFDNFSAEPKQVVSLRMGEDLATVVWTPAVLAAGWSSYSVQPAAWRRQFRIFGSNAPSQYPEPIASATTPGGIAWTVRHAGTDYSYAVDPPDSLPLDVKVEDLRPGATVLVVQSSPRQVRRANLSSADTTALKLGPIEGVVSSLTLDLRITKPAAIGDASSQLHVFGIGDDGAVWWRRQTSAGSTSYTPWASLGGNCTSFALARDASNTIRVLATGADGSLRHIAPGGTTWTKILESGANSVVAVRRVDGRIAALYRNQAGFLFFIEQSISGGWTEPVFMDRSVGLVAADLESDGRIHVFAIGTSGDLVHRRRLSSDGGWSPWTSEGGIIDLLSVVRDNAGRLHVFGRGTDKAAWHIRQQSANSSQWGTWQSLNGWIDRLAVTITSAGVVWVIVRGSDGRVYQRQQTSAGSTTWNSNWILLSGDPIGEIAAARNGNDRISVLGTSQTNELLIRSQSAPTGTLAGWGAYGRPLWPIPDRRLVTVYELTRTDLSFSNTRYPGDIAGDTVYLKQPAPEGIAAGRRLILDDASQQAEVVTATSVASVGDHLAVTFIPGLTRALHGPTAVAYANVAMATHGESVRREVLGSGDASARFQSFQLKKSPLTWIPQAGAPNGVASTLEVRVDGVRWTHVPTLLGRGAEERVYTLVTDEIGVTRVQFGGAPGARVPTGRNNVTADYRKGLGPEGNAAARRLTTLLDRPAGLRSVTNPVEAQGGTGAETIDLARINAPNTVRTFDRIVSLRDFEDAARELAVVAKARARLDSSGQDLTVLLTVAGESGQVLTGASLQTILGDLNSRRDPNRPLSIQAHTTVAVLIQARLQVDAAYDLEAVKADATASITSLLSFNARELGQPLLLTDVFRTIAAVGGVIGVDIDTLQEKSAAGNPDPADIPIPSSAIATLAAPTDLVIMPQFTQL